MFQAKSYLTKYTLKCCDEMANIVDPDQIAPKQSDLGLNFFFEL